MSGFSEEDLLATAAEYRAAWERGDRLRVVDAGRVLLVRLFAGSAEDVESESDQPPRVSLRGVAKLLGRPPSRLSVAVRTTVLYDKLPGELKDRLTAAHYELLIGVAPLEQERWAREVVLGGLSRSVLAKLLGKGSPAKPDRSPAAVARREFSRLDRQAKAVAGHATASAALVSTLDGLIAELTAIRATALGGVPVANRA